MQKKNHKFNKKFVWATSSRTLFEENTKGKKGITLIALIITIIVMLILVGVTGTVALNGGLFTTAKDSVKKQEEQEILETIIGATKYGTDEWKWIEGYENIEGYSYEFEEIEVTETYNEIVELYGESNVRDIFTKEIKKKDSQVEGLNATYEDLITVLKAYKDANQLGNLCFYNSRKATEIEFSVKGKNGEYVYIMTTEKIIPKSIYTAQEQEKRDIYNEISKNIILGNGEHVRTDGTNYYVYTASDIDLVRTYNKIEENLEKEGKQVVLVYSEFSEGTEEDYCARKLTEIVFDVVGENGSYAYSISKDNPVDNPILEIEEIDIKASKGYNTQMDKVIISAMQKIDLPTVFETQEEVYKYIGQVSGRFDVTDIKGVIECVFIQTAGDRMSYEDIETALIAEEMIKSEDQNKEQLIFNWFMDTFYCGMFKTEKEYAEYLYNEIYGEVDIFETEADACKFIGEIFGSETEITNVEGILELIEQKSYEEIKEQALTDGVITAETENPEQEIFKNLVKKQEGFETVETVEELAISLNAMKKRNEYDEGNDEEKVEISLAVNDNIVIAGEGSRNEAIMYILDSRNGTYDIRLYIDGKIGRTTVDVIEIQTVLKPGDNVYYSNINWKVLYNDSKHGLELICMDNIGEVTNWVTQYVKEGYNYAPIDVGKSITDKSCVLKRSYSLHTYPGVEKQYSGKEYYLIRNVGGPEYCEKYILNANKEYYSINNTNTKYYKAYDYYLEDYEQMKKLGILKLDGDTSALGYWLGSCIIEVEGENHKFGVRYITADGELSYSTLATINSSLQETINEKQTHLARPVITIDPSAKFTWDSANNYYTLSK